MLPRAARDAADRIITALMTLADALVASVTTRTTILPADAAQTLFHRVAALATTLIRISALGIPAKPKPKPKPDAPARTPPAPAAPGATVARRAQPTPGLPRRPGWLLAALPDTAPAIAADLRALLDDPAIATLLAAAPSLHRPLRPLLRALGLTPPAPSPDAPPPDAPQPAPVPPDPHPAAEPGPATPTEPRPGAPPPRAEIAPPALTPLHDLIITIS